MSQIPIIPVMDYRQYRKMRRLVHSCCNYDSGNCLTLDNGEECHKGYDQDLYGFMTGTDAHQIAKDSQNPAET